MPDDVPAVMMPGCPSTGSNTSGSLRRPSIVAPGARMLVDRQFDRLALRVAARRRRDFVREPARGNRRLGLRWLSSANASDSSRVMPYCRASTSAVWPITRFDSGQKNPSRYIASTSVKLPILWPQRASSLSTRYGMRLIDSMPPASTTARLAEQDRLRAERDGLQTRRARLIDRLRRRGVRQARAPTDLPRRIRSRTRLPAVADEHFVDVRGATPRALQRRPRRARAKLSRMRVAQRAAVAADGRAGGAKNDDARKGHSDNFTTNNDCQTTQNKQRRN